MFRVSNAQTSCQDIELRIWSLFDVREHLFLLEVENLALGLDVFGHVVEVAAVAAIEEGAEILDGAVDGQCHVVVACAGGDLDADGGD